MNYTIEQHEGTMTIYFYKNGTKKGEITSTNTGITNMDIYGEEREYKELMIDYINIPMFEKLLNIGEYENYIVENGKVIYKNNEIEQLKRENEELRKRLENIELILNEL